MAAAVPLYRSLLVRLLVASCVIAGCAIAATAWIAAATATSALARQQGQTLEADSEILTQLSGYAVAHNSWSGVAPLLGQLSAHFQLRIALVGTDGKAIADSAGQPASSPLPPSATATVDPLSFDTSTTPGVQRPGLDPRVIGPYRLTPEESELQRLYAEKGATCLTKQGGQVHATVLPTGRYVLTTSNVSQRADTICGDPEDLIAAPTQTETKPLADLATATATCLARQGLAIPLEMSVSPAFQLRDLLPRGESAESGEQCLQTARVDQLRPYVATPAQLYLGIGSTARERFDLSGQNRAKIIWTAAVVLAVTLAVTALAGLRLVRPLRALIHTARQDPAVFARAPVTTRDETGYLAMAFNELTERRQQMDVQRKALVADIAHELRSPLTNIRRWLEVTRDGLVEATPDLIMSLHDEAVVLQHIIDDLQDLASADAGTLRVHPQALSALDLLQQVAVAHRAQAADVGIAVTVRAEAGLEVFADPARIRQVLGNLVSNAVRHTPSGGLVTVAARAVDRAVEVSVTDTGCGIAQAELSLIFDRFWRSEKSRSRSTGGSGLGLAIARHLVLAHGGTIRAESVVGVGTTMTVRLPVQAGESW